MFHSHSHKKQYALAAILGAAGAGLAMKLARKAAPKLKTELMPRIMHRMMMKGFNPAEM